MRDTLECVVIAIAATVAMALAAHCIQGCASEPQLLQNVENGAAVMQYDMALKDCQRAARSFPADQRFDAYLACEKGVSRHYCEESLELRKSWTRCTELGL